LSLKRFRSVYMCMTDLYDSHRTRLVFDFYTGETKVIGAASNIHAKVSATTSVVSIGSSIKENLRRCHDGQQNWIAKSRPPLPQQWRHQCQQQEQRRPHRSRAKNLKVAAVVVSPHIMYSFDKYSPSAYKIVTGNRSLNVPLDHGICLVHQTTLDLIDLDVHGWLLLWPPRPKHDRTAVTATITINTPKR